MSSKLKHSFFLAIACVRRARVEEDQCDRRVGNKCEVDEGSLMKIGVEIVVRSSGWMDWGVN